ncbi:acetyl/propionyl/methylcrotonyl-CoA carboxylase subunit alpha [Hydrogenophaga atypica]|uniref:Acetyl/propionyl/methylcrotonyl-CoA carboxylase subunit alpha n=1 Tax=Hydrogenophaga atypica TaxID=249409 RepID=A0ABW2QM23_9BURK
MKKLLIANRGEIARRVIHTAHKVGIATVAVFSDPDAKALHVREAGEAVALGGSASSDSYLRMDKLIAAAQKTGADAIHPGYGFLSENADFAQAVIDAGLTWVGPPPAAIHAVGSKSGAKALALAHGVPCLPGYFGADQSEATLAREAARIGYPVMVKAVAGGGGRGMRLVLDAAQLPAALHSARSEAVSAFGNGDLLIERALLNPRHVEVQVFADTHGHCIHLGERDCSVQRRHQKIIEEAPSPAVDAALRERMGACAVALAQAAGYVGAGTVEFLLDGGEWPAAGPPQGGAAPLGGSEPREAGSVGAQFFLMEMNTRLQVEHPVTEALIGQDLVEWQLRIARGEALPLTQDQVHLQGHAIELRLCAEDADFRPHTGVVSRFRAPPHAAFERRGLRLDHALEDGAVVSPFYDAMLGKLIAHAPTRDEAIAKLHVALRQLQLLGLPTNRDFLGACLDHPVFRAGQALIPFLAEHGDVLRAQLLVRERAAIPAAVLAMLLADAPPTLSLGCGYERPVRVRHEGVVSHWGFTATGPAQARLRDTETEHHITWQRDAGGHWALEADGLRRHAAVVRAGSAALDGAPRWQVLVDGVALWLDDLSLLPQRQGGAAGAADQLRAPFNGKVVALHVAPGDVVEQGAPVLVLESMKLEHSLAAPRSGVVEAVLVSPGQQAAPGQVLLRLVAQAKETA